MENMGLILNTLDYPWNFSQATWVLFTTLDEIKLKCFFRPNRSNINRSNKFWRYKYCISTRNDINLIFTCNNSEKNTLHTNNSPPPPPQKKIKKNLVVPSFSFTTKIHHNTVFRCFLTRPTGTDILRCGCCRLCGTTFQCHNKTSRKRCLIRMKVRWWFGWMVF